MHSVLASMLSQPGSQISLGANPFFSAPPVEVPDIPSCGSTGGRSAKSLIRGRISFPSGVVPPSSQEDVMPPISVSHVVSVGLAGVSGSHLPPLGASTPVLGRGDQLRDRGDVGLTQHVVSADVHSVPRCVSSFNPSSLLFPFSHSGFSSPGLGSSSFLFLYRFLFLLFCTFCSFSGCSYCSHLFSSFCCAFCSFCSSSSFFVLFPLWPSFCVVFLTPFSFFSSLLSPFFSSFSSRFLVFLFCFLFLSPCVLFLLLFLVFLIH